MALTPVPFSKPRGHRERISKPYVPGRHSDRYWTSDELDVIRAHFATGGAPACLAHLPAHRTPSGVYQQARKLGLKAKEGGGKKQRIETPPDFDEILRRAYAAMSGKKRGEVNALADGLGLPRWFVTKRATKLGLTMPHRKEPPWTAAEDALLRKVPLLDLEKCAEIFRQHGFMRSPTAINVRSKRQALSRRATRETVSAREAALILGIDSKAVTAWCIAGELPAARREDQRSSQQGGSAWAIHPADLRIFILNHLDRIDFRKVEKFAFVDLIANQQKEPPPCTSTSTPSASATTTPRRSMPAVPTGKPKSAR